MGANISVKEQSVVNDAVNKVVNKKINTNDLTDKTTNKCENGMELFIKCVGAPSSFTVNQECTNIAKQVSNLTGEDRTAMTNDLLNDLKSTLTEETKQKNSGLNLLQANVSKVLQSVENNSNNDIQNIIETQTKRHFQTENTSANNLNVTYTGSCSGTRFNFSQTAMVDTFKSSTIKDISDLLILNKATNKTSTDLTSKTSQVNEGLGSLGGLLFLLILVFLLFKKPVSGRGSVNMKYVMIILWILLIAGASVACYFWTVGDFAYREDSLDSIEFISFITCLSLVILLPVLATLYRFRLHSRNHELQNKYPKILDLVFWWDVFEKDYEEKAVQRTKRRPITAIIEKNRKQIRQQQK
jgi:DNA-binding ferritin-like protein (Dps family)